MLTSLPQHGWHESGSLSPGLSIPHNLMSQAGESQRDSGSKPRVASSELPGEKAPESGQPQRGCAG